MLWSLVGLALLAASQDQTRQYPPAESGSQRIQTAPDDGDRMQVAVQVAGSGPYRFVVDTGAERTAISEEVARALNLSAGPELTVTSLARTSRVPSVVIPDLRVGTRTVRDIRAPALAQSNLGAHGLLGADSLQQQLVGFDFDRDELLVTRARAQRRPVVTRDEIVVEARTRLGRLIVTNAMLDGQRVTVIIDTGSQITLGNEALRRIMTRRRSARWLPPVQVWDVTGGTFTAEYMVSRQFRLDSITFNDLPIAFGSAHLFEQLSVSRRPALLLGMDSLRLFRRVSIDFLNRRLTLLPATSARQGDLRYAARRGGVSATRS